MSIKDEVDSVRAKFQRELDGAEARVARKAIKGPDEPRGYHLREFDRGVYGESSKILEEVLELQDAEEQNARIMGLHELSDILGAIYGYLRKHYPDMKFEDLITMANITRRAFESGHRK